jgi:acylphosphatase
MKKQVHVIFSGRVQGVGFRYTTEEIARQFAVKGWVKNVAGGRVELMAEAEESILNDFLEDIKREFSGYIKDMEAQWDEARGNFEDFRITF